VVLDGTLIRTDRCREKTISVRGEPVDLWYCGKVRSHAGNVQAVLAPDGLPLWVSDAEPGSVHDINAARLHALPTLYAAAAAGLAGLADAGYDGASPASRPRLSSAATTRPRASMPALATCCCTRYGAGANAASPCSKAAGAPSSGSPPAPARPVISPAPLVLTYFEHGYLE
jgi:hypothetical protein